MSQHTNYSKHYTKSDYTRFFQKEKIYQFVGQYKRDCNCGKHYKQILFVKFEDACLKAFIGERLFDAGLLFSFLSFKSTENNTWSTLSAQYKLLIIWEFYGCPVISDIIMISSYFFPIYRKRELNKFYHFSILLLHAK